jgi:hypothetical protein
LAGGINYEFRAFAIDLAGNAGDKSEIRSTKVTGAGCIEQITVSIAQPAPGSLVDAQGGTGTKQILYTAATTGTFSSTAFIRIRIEFSPDDGKHWVTLAPDIDNTGAYLWTVNAPTCDACRIRIFATALGGQNATGLSANFEVINGNPTTDFDNNGMYDECEIRYFEELGVVRPNDDTDADGLKNQQECVHSTDPTNPDTDGDGATDGVEVRLGRDPLNANDVPSSVERRFEEWGNYYLIIPGLFLAATVVFLLGAARRW